MYPVISVAQLEPLLSGENPYNRPGFNHTPVIETKKDIPTYQSYEIEKLVGKRTRKYNKTEIVQYLIKWFGYGPEHNQWKTFSAFNDYLKLVNKNKKRRCLYWQRMVKNVGKAVAIIEFTSEIDGFFFVRSHIV